jgi:small subunit ribosomal protein S16
VLRIRLRRTGARKRPNYRIVVADSRAPRDGQFIEIIGFYDPLTDPSTVRVDGDKARRWLTNGAQPSDRVARLFVREGIIAGGQPGATPDESAAEVALDEPSETPARATRKRASSGSRRATAATSSDAAASGSDQPSGEEAGDAAADEADAVPSPS